MATVAKLDPVDHGKPMAFEEFMAGDYREGYHYELIKGKLYVSPMANLPEDYIEQWLYQKLLYYANQHLDVINRVTNKARVFVPGERRTTCPEPDLAAFHGFPTHLPIRRMRWQDVSPILGGEVISADDPDKDL